MSARITPFRRKDCAECEFCGAAIDSSLICPEPDCGADMRHHWENTTPHKIFEAQCAIGRIIDTLAMNLLRYG